jgi:glutathione S-transferase
MNRMAASMLYFKGFQIRVAPGEQTDFPFVNRWFDAMETLPSYQLTKSDYYTHCWDLPPQLGGCVSEPGAERFQEAINGRTPGSWSLPLTPHNGGFEPDWAWAGGLDDDSIARREAVERVSANHEAIVAFASRGAGQEGFPRYGAPLSDPNAVSNDAIQPLVDAVLRAICSKLLEDGDTMNEIQSVLTKEGGEDVIELVIKSLEYMRDRVGVPRDMRLPAARQLRAHVNWAIDTLLK